jgi:hypothetical protein
MIGLRARVVLNPVIVAYMTLGGWAKIGQIGPVS